MTKLCVEHWDTSLVSSPFSFHPPTDTLTLALAMARLTSLVKETLMQNTPESLKNWRRISWQSGEGVAALQTVSIGVMQSASEMTVQTSFGKLKQKPCFWIQFFCPVFQEFCMGYTVQSLIFFLLLRCEIRIKVTIHLPWQVMVTSTAFWSNSVSTDTTLDICTIATLSIPSKGQKHRY